MARSKEEQRIYRHEYYIANKDRELKLMEIYKANNPEKIKEIKDKLVENGYYKDYYESNKEEILKNNRTYKKNKYKEFERHVVYLLINKDLETLYTGSSGNIAKRMDRHLSGWSHLELTKEKWDLLECSHFEYCYLDNVTKDERLYVESLLINKHNAILNSYEPIRNSNKITEERKAELEEYCDSLVFKIWNM